MLKLQTVNINLSQYKRTVQITTVNQYSSIKIKCTE